MIDFRSDMERLLEGRRINWVLFLAAYILWCAGDATDVVVAFFELALSYGGNLDRVEDPDARVGVVGRWSGHSRWFRSFDAFGRGSRARATEVGEYVRGWG